MPPHAPKQVIDYSPRVAVLFDSFGPYHRARLNAASRRVNLLAIEVFGQTREYAWQRSVRSTQLRYQVVFPDSDNTRTRSGDVRRRIYETLARLRPHVVFVPGWSSADALSALRWAKQSRVPAVVMSESQACDAERRFWRERPKRRLVRMCDAGLVGGVAHREYLEDLGMPPHRIFDGYDVVDNDHFARGADTARADAAEMRIRLRLPQHYFLASKRFLPKKNIRRLLEAFALYRTGAGEGAWHLVILGDGPLRPAVLRWIHDLDLHRYVHLPGFRQYDELPAFYGLASALVHASTTEPWGLVVNEAMAAGLPVLVSERCGCARDLIVNGSNGWVFDPESVEDLTTALGRMAAPMTDRARMVEASRSRIAAYSTTRFAEGVAAAADSVLAAQPMSVSRSDSALLQLLLHR